jgi:hypothetical protein
MPEDITLRIRWNQKSNTEIRMNRLQYGQLVLAVGVVIALGVSHFRPAADKPYVELERDVSATIYGGQYTCPSQTHDPANYCPVVVGLTCTVVPVWNGWICATGPGGAVIACNFNCTKAGRTFPGQTYTTHATIVTPPCPAVPAHGCWSVYDPLFNTWSCACLPPVANVNCAAYGNYQNTGTCARY